MKVYTNPKCSKSRTLLKALTEKGLSFTEVRYLEAGISSTEVLEIAKILGIEVHKIVRAKESVYKDFQIDWHNDISAAKAIEKQPILLQRPIVMSGSSGAVVRDSNVLESFLRQIDGD